MSLRPSALLGAPLTRREVEVLYLLALDLSTAEIGARLFIAETTVKSHLKHIGPKLGCRERAGMVGAAYRNLIFSVPAADSERYDAGHRDGWRACATLLAGAVLEPLSRELVGADV